MEFKQNDFLAIDIMQGNKKLGTEYYVFYRYRTDEYKENTFDAVVVIPFNLDEDETEVIFGLTNVELNEGLRYATIEEKFMMTDEIVKQYNYIKFLNRNADFIKENVF